MTGEVTREEARALVKRHGGISRAARAIGMDRCTFKRRLAGIQGPRHRRPPGAPGPAQSVGVQELLKPFDLAAQIADQVAGLERGQFLPDAVLRVALGSPSDDRWRRAARSQRVAAFRLDLPDRSVAWALPSDVRDAKRKILEGTL